MGASVRVLEMHYAHLVDSAEDVARAKLDGRAIAGLGVLVGVAYGLAPYPCTSKAASYQGLSEVERAGIEPATSGLQSPIWGTGDRWA
jgi:hypothetical protein